VDPEVMRSIELVFDFTMSEQLRFSFNVFDYQWDDIIDFYPIGGGANQAQNIGEQEGQGLEAELHWTISSQLSLTSNISYVDAEKSLNGLTTTAANTPDKLFFVAADYDITNGWSMHLRSNWVMDRERESGDLRAAIDDFNMTDLALNYRPAGSKWSFDLAVQNIFDEDASEPNSTGTVPNDYPLAGTSASATLRFNF
jgi:iron complex outermembrane receptor protein